MRESEIEKRVCDKAKLAGWLCLKFSSPSYRGVPDRIFMRNGIMFFVEFKMQGKKPSLLQTHNHSLINSSGFKVYVIDNVIDGYQLIEKYDK